MGWKGRDRTEREPCRGGEESWGVRPITREAVCHFYRETAKFPYPSTMLFLHSTRGSMGEFSKKKASLGYFLSVDPSNSSHVSNSLRLSVYGRMSSPPPPGEKGLEPCLAGLRSEGRGRTGLPSQQKSLQKSGPALERHRERSGGRTSWEEV